MRGRLFGSASRFLQLLQQQQLVQQRLLNMQAQLLQQQQSPQQLMAIQQVLLAQQQPQLGAANAPSQLLNGAFCTDDVLQHALIS